MSNPTITVGMASFDDPRTAITMQNLKVNHGIKNFVIADSAPHTQAGKELASYCKKTHYGRVRVKYIPMPENLGTTQPRQRIFEEAETDVIVVMDPHVVPEPDTLAKLQQYLADHPECLDLLSGPMIDEAGNVIATHFNDVWGEDGMWGKWGNDPRGQDRNGEPFEIPGMGLGMFACRKAAWPGFNPHFRGFGGEEMYIHEKFRLAGRRALCCPWMPWWHDFSKLKREVAYPNTWPDRCQNYVLGHLETGRDVWEVHKEYVAKNRVSQAMWNEILSNPLARPSQATTVVTPPPQPKPLPQPAKKEEPNLPPTGSDLDAIYEWTRNKKRDLDQHLPKLKELASQCEHVTEFTNRRESTVGLAAGRPKTLVSYQRERDPLNKILHAAVKTQNAIEVFDVFEGADSLSPDVAPIEETDLLFIDSPPHNADRLWAELEKHGGKVRRYLVLHDTAYYSLKGEPGPDGQPVPGLMHALTRLMTEKPEWSVVYHTQEEYGLTVLSRDERDKPKLPSHITMANNFRKAWTDYIFDGFKKATKEQYEQRLLRCTVCEQRTDDRCAACGCYLIDKASKRVMACPLGRWAEIDANAAKQAAGESPEAQEVTA